MNDLQFLWTDEADHWRGYVARGYVSAATSEWFAVLRQQDAAWHVRLWLSFCDEKVPTWTTVLTTPDFEEAIRAAETMRRLGMGVEP